DVAYIPYGATTLRALATASSTGGFAGYSGSTAAADIHWLLDPDCWAGPVGQTGSAHRAETRFAPTASSQSAIYAEELAAADALFALSAAGSSDLVDHFGQTAKADILFNQAGYLPACFSAV